MSKARRNNANRIQIFDFITEKIKKKWHVLLSFMHMHDALIHGIWSLWSLEQNLKRKCSLWKLMISVGFWILINIWGHYIYYLFAIHICTIWWILYMCFNFKLLKLASITLPCFGIFISTKKEGKKKQQKNGSWSSRSCCRIFPFVFCWPSVMF
jgi:hypothetical protein